ncbi:MAG TPA: isopentenyl phosphate kinase [Thermoanaerobaculia bacterium]|nr:isopentenyl phosphate kinase [Thermoanaerobaculia bacterium]
MSSDLVLVKLGGSLITHKGRSSTARPQRLRRLAGELAAARRDGIPLLVGHGSGSFGHFAAAAHGLAGSRAIGVADGPGTRERLRGIGRTQQSAQALHRLVLHHLEEAGALPFSLAPSSFLVAGGGEPKKVLLEPLERALDLGLLPVTYGDVVLDRCRGASIASTEAVLLALARRLLRHRRRISRALWLGDTAGVLDAAGSAVTTLDAASWKHLRPAIAPPPGPDVTGGMALRVDSALALAAAGVESWILDGRDQRVVRRALRGEPVPATVVRPVAGGAA